MPRIARPRFNKFSEDGALQRYVAVRPFKRGSDLSVKPGDLIRDMPIHILRRYFNLRWIGQKGHPWTEQALNNQGDVLKSYYTTDEKPVAEKEPLADKPKKRGRPSVKKSE